MEADVTPSGDDTSTVSTYEEVRAAVDALVLEKTSTMSEEQRATYEDTRDMLSAAVAAKLRGDGDDDADDWTYIEDFTDEWVVYFQNNQKFQADYSLDGDTVTLGDSQPVREITTYVPIEQKSTPKDWATPKRAFSTLMEQPPATVGDFAIRLGDWADTAGVAHKTGDSPTEAVPVATFVGYASTTGVPYNVRDWLGEYAETMLPGAFAKTLREQANVPLLFNHDGIPLASTGSGTSRLAEDGVGLRNEADLDRRDALTNSVCVQLQRGVLNKMSFSFRAIKETWNEKYDERGVAEAALYDSSIVTYPANPTTTGELVDSMRSALGREGRSLWLAEHELLVRSALPIVIEQRELDADGEDLLERALRALTHADEQLCRRYGLHGRARTFHVASTLLELRAGKTLSAANQALLQQALDALGQADRSHAKTQAAHTKASEAISGALNSASGTGQDGNQGPDNGNPINPQDGAGPRSAAIRLRREREAEIRRLRRSI